jgi:hypothetical protein
VGGIRRLSQHVQRVAVEEDPVGDSRFLGFMALYLAGFLAFKERT